ncbi:MAG TPA: CPBP family intramembrane glutamic endopeptidase [Candidatus Saccharimonadales bacterium]|nr:CPBP family intramembrane glutamic endopeptidase [Candidatus Saccharimonadales bacterium]
MLRNYLNKFKREKRTYRWKFAFLLPLWVVVGFGVSQLLITGILLGLNYAGVPLTSINPAVINTVLAASVYVLTLVLVLGVPFWTQKRRTSKDDLGIARSLSWTDIGLAPAGFIVYFIVSAILVYVVTLIIPGFDVGQVQDVGFENLSQQYEVLLAFVTLVIVAPLAEELLFRGYLYGKLRKSVPIGVAMIITSIIFGLVHGQWNVAVDVFALSMVMCTLREITGSIWAGVLLHSIKNGLAFYLLFINPTFLNTIGG